MFMAIVVRMVNLFTLQVGSLKCVSRCLSYYVILRQVNSPQCFVSLSCSNYKTWITIQLVPQNKAQVLILQIKVREIFSLGQHCQSSNGLLDSQQCNHRWCLPLWTCNSVTIFQGHSYGLPLIAWVCQFPCLLILN